MRVKVWALIVMLGLFLTAGRVLGQAPTSPSPADTAALDELVKTLDENPERVFALSDKLKAHPYGDDAMTTIAVLTQYGVASHKIELHLGSMLIPLSTPRHEDIELRLFGQFVTGLIVYAVEHQGKAGDSVESNMYATSAMLSAYHTMLVQKPQAHNLYADKLLSMKHAGQLPGFIQQAVATDKALPTATPSTSGSATPLPGEPTDAPSAMPAPDGAATGQL